MVDKRKEASSESLQFFSLSFLNICDKHCSFHHQMLDRALPQRGNLCFSENVNIFLISKQEKGSTQFLIQPGHSDAQVHILRLKLLCVTRAIMFCLKLRTFVISGNFSNCFNFMIVSVQRRLPWRTSCSSCQNLPFDTQREKCRLLNNNGSDFSF